jgi:hypothetical protein
MILALFILFFLYEYKTKLVKNMIPITVESVAESGSFIRRPQGIAATRAASTRMENKMNDLSFILTDEL